MGEQHKNDGCAGIEPQMQQQGCSHDALLLIRALRGVFQQRLQRERRCKPGYHQKNLLDKHEIAELFLRKNADDKKDEPQPIDDGKPLVRESPQPLAEVFAEFHEMLTPLCHREGKGAGSEGCESTGIAPPSRHSQAH